MPVQLSLFPQVFPDLIISEEVVYFARRGKYLKIGTTVDITRRMRELHASPLVTVPGGRALERRLHDRFARSRVLDEWFKPTPEMWEYIYNLRSGWRAAA